VTDARTPCSGVPHMTRRSHNPKVVGSNPTPATIASGQRPSLGTASLRVGPLPPRYRDHGQIGAVHEAGEGA
jgi:hypothetical protein